MNVIHNKVSNPGSLGHEETPFITMQLDDNHDLCPIFIIIKVFSTFAIKNLLLKYATGGLFLN